jgi:hypothetical protein
LKGRRFAEAGMLEGLGSEFLAIGFAGGFFLFENIFTTEGAEV